MNVYLVHQDEQVSDRASIDYIFTGNGFLAPNLDFNLSSYVHLQYPTSRPSTKALMKPFQQMESISHDPLRRLIFEICLTISLSHN